MKCIGCNASLNINDKGFCPDCELANLKDDIEYTATILRKLQRDYRRLTGRDYAPL